MVLPDWYGPENNPPLPLVISPHGRGVGVQPGEEAPRMGSGFLEIAVLGICAFGVLYLGLAPNGSGWPFDVHVLDWARDSVRGLFAS